MTMHIVVDGRYISDYFPGIGRYTYNLVRTLRDIAPEHHYTLLVNPLQANSRFDLTGIAQAITEARPFTLREQWEVSLRLRRLRADVYHTPYYIAPYLVPGPMVVTVHDAISSRYPQYMPGLLPRISYEVAMRMALGAARRVITVSRASRDDLIRFFGVDPHKITVIPEAADAWYSPQSAEEVARVRARYALPPRYVLYLGTNKPHKNLVRLVEAWAQVNDPALLVLAGREDPRYPAVRVAVQRLGLGGRVRILGQVAENDLPGLYSGAVLFVFPSLYEGFGLPVLEAMACGTPVLCSETPALVEIAQGAAVMVNPLDVAGLASALRTLLRDRERREDLRLRGLARAAHYSWKRAARETLQVYEACTGR
jgi:alpha-1,3-rhamnosyl/mannosyltransferase